MGEEQTRIDSSLTRRRFSIVREPKCPCEIPFNQTITCPFSSVPGNGFSRGPLTNVHQGDALLKERDDVISKLGSEIGRLSAFESECSRKDSLIAELQAEIVALNDRLAAPKAEFQQKLAGLEQEVVAKAEEIKALREQIDNLQKNTSEVLYHSLSERDLQIAHWKNETETLKKSYSLTTGAFRNNAEGALREECIWRLQQLQEMGRRERLIRSDMDLAVTQIVEKIKHIEATNAEYCRKEMELREEMRVKRSEMEQVSENIERLKKALEGVQDFLQTPYCSHSLQKKVFDLQNINLTPPASDVQAASVQILGGLLNWVDAMEGLLQDLELDLPACEKGMSSYIKELRDHHHHTMARLQTIEASQETFLQEKLKELKDQLQEEFQGKEKDLLEAEKEHQKVLEEMVALEEEKWKDAVEEEKKKVKALETQVKQLAEVIEQKGKSETMLHTRIMETLEDFEAAQRRKTFAEEKLLVYEKRLKSLENEMKSQTRKHLEEISEYKEQVKQHSQTIVHLEQKYMEAVQHMEKAREENGKLSQQIEEMQKVPCKSYLPEATSPERFHVFLKKELEVAKHRILSDEVVIAELKKELSEARARVSDAIGELSEKQKMELEQKRSVVQNQLHEISHLQEELLKMRTLVGQKDTDLQVVREELRNIREKLKTATKERDGQHKGVQTEAPPVEDAAGKGPVLALSDLGLRCKGSRHEETIQRQKEALAELRHLVKALEKACPSDSEERKPEAVIVCKKISAEKKEQKTEKEPGTGVVTTADTNKLQSRVDPNVTIERTARLEMADALDLSENMYLNVMRDLANLADVKELAGARTVMHLPHDEREKLKLLRQKDLQLLCRKIGQMKTRLERKESLLKEYEKDVGKFRANHQTLRACQSEIAKLGDRIYQEKEEKALLKEALERTRLQLIQERRLNRTLKHHHKAATPKKTFPESPKTIESREKRVPSKAKESGVTL
nr:forkhead-associated domain-containing protein 1-like [Anolis sagrei ordinatus]